MSFFNKTEDEIKQGVRDLAKSELGVTELRSAGVLAGLVETCAKLTSWIYKTYIFPLKAQIGLDSATGIFLDSWGNMFGVTRKSASKTRGVITGDAYQSGNIQSNNKITFAGTGLFYLVETAVPFSVGEFTFKVLAEKTGGEYNVDNSRTPILVSHVTGINGLSLAVDWIKEQGAEQESDESYRTRIQARWLSIAAGDVPVLYESEAMSITGVAEAKVFRTPQGYGSTRVVIRGENNSAPTSVLITSVRKQLEYVGLIARALVIEPVVLRKLIVSFSYTGNIRKQEAEQRVYSYFSKLKIGVAYTMQDLYNLFDDVSNIVFDMPTKNDSGFPVDAIYDTVITARKEHA